MQGTEALTISFPFTALGAAERRAALHMLPQAHTCTNTLELPDYYSALMSASAADRQGAAIAGVAWGSAEDLANAPRVERWERGITGAGGAAQGGAWLRARCKEVLAERLEYAVVHGAGAYALDDLDE
jgi:hypothetical protein